MSDQGAAIPSPRPWLIFVQPASELQYNVTTGEFVSVAVKLPRSAFPDFGDEDEVLFRLRDNEPDKQGPMPKESPEPKMAKTEMPRKQPEPKKENFKKK